MARLTGPAGRVAAGAAAGALLLAGCVGAQDAAGASSSSVTAAEADGALSGWLGALEASADHLDGATAGWLRVGGVEVARFVAADGGPVRVQVRLAAAPMVGLAPESASAALAVAAAEAGVDGDGGSPGTLLVEVESFPDVLVGDDESVVRVVCAVWLAAGRDADRCGDGLEVSSEPRPAMRSLPFASLTGDVEVDAAGLGSLAEVLSTSGALELATLPSVRATSDPQGMARRAARAAVAGGDVPEGASVTFHGERAEGAFAGLVACADGDDVVDEPC
jgi:hypothetical protein